MAETTRYGNQEYTWDELVKKLGPDRARQIAPEIDPKYQQLVKQEGQAKGSEDYSHQYMDPKTVTAHDWRDLLSGQGIGSAVEQGAESAAKGYLKGMSPDVLFAAATPGMPYFAAEAAAQELKAGKQEIHNLNDPSGGGGKHGGPPPPPPGDPTAAANDAAINQMYQGILGQFQQAANFVNPYIGGEAMPAESQNAQALANRFAGGGVQGPDASIQGVLNKDFQAEKAANQAGQLGVYQAVQGMNQASQAQANVAPYSQLLSALASHAQSQIVYGNAQPDVSKSPGYVAEALAAANQLQSSTANTGATAVTPNVQTGTGSTVPGASTTQNAAGV